MTMQLHYAPGACSLACHIALEEAGSDYAAHRVDLAAGGNRTPEYLAINPHGNVPALVVNGMTLTEGPAILGYVGRLGGGLAPADAFAEAQALSFIAWCSSTVHVTFARVFRPERIAGEAAADAVKVAALAALPDMFAEIEERFAGGEWACGDRYSVADGYPFVFLRWARRVGLDLTAYPHWQQHGWRMLERPAVKRVVEREGLHAADWIEAN